jgi:hypothetical protein
MTPREEAALRVAALHPPLPRIFAMLRAGLREDGPPPPAAAAPVVAPVVAEPEPDPLLRHVREGVEAARAAGVPDGDVDLDAALALAAGDPARARNAGVLAAVRAADGWEAVQRFGAPWCPSPGCYGRDGSVLGDAVPPFADDCNCRAEPTQVR